MVWPRQRMEILIFRLASCTGVNSTVQVGNKSWQQVPNSKQLAPAACGNTRDSPGLFNTGMAGEFYDGRCD